MSIFRLPWHILIPRLGHIQGLFQGNIQFEKNCLNMMTFYLQPCGGEIAESVHISTILNSIDLIFF